MRESTKRGLEEALKGTLGNGFEVNQAFPLAGGDINEVYHLQTSKGHFCIKLNDADRYPGMLRAEARGLEQLRDGGQLRIPEVVHVGSFDGVSYLLLEFVPTGKPVSDFWGRFGEQLAMLHRCSLANGQFGNDINNYIGTLPQSNTWQATWHDFFIGERMQPQLNMLKKQNAIDQTTERNILAFFEKAVQTFPEEKPALLHGDLWSGNYLVGDQGEPVLIDPAVYFGHREMDLGMMHLFGGFDEKLYEVYNFHYPLEKGWKTRIKLTQLYPLLVHANLFGGHYVEQVKRITGNW